MTIAIKGMVCRHCIEAVEAILASLSLGEAHVSLGEADIPDTATADPNLMAALDRELKAHGFSRILNRDSQLVERTKQTIIDHVRNHDCRFNLSACLHDRLGTDYIALSKLFSAHEGRTIEKYAIAQRVEYAKELLSYGELNISEVAFKAGYSSVPHLSRQFKTVTGMTPSAYQKLRPQRIPLNEV